MNADQLLLLVYLLLPFAAAFVPLGVRSGGLLSKGTSATAVRILILLALARGVVSLAGSVAVKTSLLHGYPLEILLTLNTFRYGFLVVAEFCFLLAHWMCPVSVPNEGLIRTLVCFAQGFCSLLLLSDNSVTTGGFLLMAGVVLFYLIRFSVPDKEEEIGAVVSARVHVLFFLLGLLMIAWGVTEFGSRDLVFGRATGSGLGLNLWLALVVLSIPLPPWSRWFSHAMEHLPEGVVLTLVTFLSGLALKAASLFNVSYPDLGWKQKLLLYVLGVIGCGFSVAGLFGAANQRRMLSCLPGFFFSIVLVSLGVSQKGLVLSAYFSCLFVPVLTGLALSAAAVADRGSLQRLFVGLLFALVMGVPGTPVYQIFSGIGARSLDLGVAYTTSFGLLWFFYFSTNVHICRRFFIDREAPSGERSVALPDGARAIFAGYGIFLLFLLIAVAQVAGRLL
ncbi:MAG TPA: hypothetical protein VIH99_11255 [Bdellovibrionota bacterium]|jgi:hypothetical protein